MNYLITSVSVALLSLGIHASGWGQEALSGQNPIRNPGFERPADERNLPVDWWFSAANGARATCTLDSTTARSGKRSLKITNESAQFPHVYGHLYQEAFAVKPNTGYVFGVWVKGSRVGASWFGGGRDWRLRWQFPRGTYGWQWVAAHYVTEADETTFAFRVIVEDVTEALWMDDLECVEGSKEDLERRRQRAELEARMLAAGETGYVCLRAPVAPTVDGKLDDWQGIPAIRLPENDARIVSLVANGYTGPEDLVASLQLMYDDSALYMAVEVADDVFVQEHVGETTWTGDSLQVAFDPALTRSVGTFDQDDYEYTFALTSAGPQAYRTFAASGIPGGLVAGIELTVGAGKAGTRSYEVRIPWKELSPFRPSPTQSKIGFNLLVNDNDGAGRACWIELTPGIGRSKDPSRYRTVLFAGMGAEALRAKGKELACRVVLEGRSALASETISPTVEWLSTRSFPEARARLLLKVGGKALLDSTQKVNVTEGEGKVGFAWSLATVPGGRHRVVARVLDAGGKQLDAGEVELLVLNEEEVRANLAEMRRLRDELHAVLVKAQAKKIHTPYELAVRRLLDHFIYCVDHDLTKKTIPMWNPQQVIEMTGQAKRDEVQRAAQNAAFMVVRGREALAHARTVLANPAAQTVVPEYDLTNLTISDGQFRQNGKPVFLIGSLCWSELEQDMPILREYGFNFVELEGGPMEMPEDAAASVTLDVEPRFEAAAEHNLAIDRLLSLHYLPQWFEGKHTGETCLEYPWKKQVYERWLRPLTQAHAGHPALHSYIMANEPVYQCYCDKSQENFRRAMQEQYGAIARANATWGTDFAGFEHIEVRRDTQLTPGLRYDWCRFNEDRFTDFFRWMKGIIREADRKTPVHIKITNDYLWYGNYFESGIDREALAEVCDIVGCDGNFHYPGTEFALGFESQIIAYDLLKSFAPDKPIVDSEWTTGGPGDFPAEYFYTALWQTFLHGVCGANIWVWDRTEGSVDLRDRFLRRAPALYGASRAALDLRRLAPYIARFPQQQAEVAILYAMPSVLHSDYLSQMRRLYSGLCFLDTPIRFVTERQVARGELSRYKVVFVPQVRHAHDTTYESMCKYAAGRGRVVLAGECFFFDEHGRKRDPRGLTELASVRRVEPAEGAKTQPALDAILDEAGVVRPVRVKDLEGNPVRGVESRTVKTQDGYTTYLINLNRSQVNVRLDSSRRIRTAVDLITGRRVDCKDITLPSLTPMLLRLAMN